jgi:glycine cleavage system T protein (aminomethyltransferase)
MKRTRFYPYQQKLGGRMIEFFGWEMPVEYTGIISEHLAVRQKAGLFDVSHMGEIHVRGPQALDFLQHLTPNDVSRLAPGQAQYTALTTPRGTFVDDLLIYCLEPSLYLLVVNASNSDKDFRWVADHAASFKVKVENVSEAFSQLALQGPAAHKILQPLTDIPLAQMKSFAAAQGRVAGVSSLVSRTGYTGEDGFEVYTSDPSPGRLWEAILEQGKPYGLLPVGLGARDTLRLEAKLMLYGNDIDDTTTPLEAGLGWTVKLAKGDFNGRDVLVRQKEQGVARKLVGLELDGRRVPRHGMAVEQGGRVVGRVTSGTFGPSVQRPIGMAYVESALATLGTTLDVVAGEARLPARVVKTPFYTRGSRLK